jgi:hypothetical protein
VALFAIKEGGETYRIINDSIGNCDDAWNLLARLEKLYYFLELLWVRLLARGSGSSAALVHVESTLGSGTLP